MKYRKLRIVWSVAWGITCALLVVLWVRSYFRSDAAIMPRSSKRAILLNSSIGRIQLIEFLNSQPVKPARATWSVSDVDKYLDKDPQMAILRQQLMYIRAQLEQFPAKARGRPIQALEHKMDEYRNMVRQKAIVENQLAAGMTSQQLNAIPPSLAFRTSNRFGFGFKWQAIGLACEFPYWLPVIVSGVLVAVPWIHKPSWRFSLRTLLIATTLVAVLLGLIVWSA